MRTWFSPAAASAVRAASAAQTQDSAAYQPAQHPAQSADVDDSVTNQDLHGTFTSPRHAPENKYVKKYTAAQMTQTKQNFVSL